MIKLRAKGHRIKKKVKAIDRRRLEQEWRDATCESCRFARGASCFREPLGKLIPRNEGPYPACGEWRRSLLE